MCRSGLLNDGYSSDLSAEIFKCFWYLAHPRIIKLDFLMRAQELVFLIILVNVLYAALVEDKEDRGAIYNFTNIERESTEGS